MRISTTVAVKFELLELLLVQVMKVFELWPKISQPIVHTYKRVRAFTFVNSSENFNGIRWKFWANGNVLLFFGKPSDNRRKCGVGFSLTVIASRALLNWGRFLTTLFRSNCIVAPIIIIWRLVLIGTAETESPIATTSRGQSLIHGGAKPIRKRLPLG